MATYPRTRNTHSSLTVLAVFLLVLGVLVTVPPQPVAEAAFPGGNAALSMSVRDTGMAVMDPADSWVVTGYHAHEGVFTNGSGTWRFYRDDGEWGKEPSWSSDGSQLVVSIEQPGMHPSESGYCSVGGSGIWADGYGCVVDTGAMDVSPAWSPDGTRIAYISKVSGSSGLYVVDVGSGAVTTLTTARSYSPSWSPDGSLIAFVRAKDIYGPHSHEIATINPDGTDLRLITSNNVEEGSPDWSPDGSQIVFHRRSGSGLYDQADIWIMNADGTGQAPVVATPDTEENPAWSPDGSLIAYDRVDGSAQNVYTIPVAGGTPTQHSYMRNDSTQSSSHPTWQPVPDGSGGGDPYFIVDTGLSFGVEGHGDGIWGHHWPASTPITITIDNDIDPGNGILHRIDVATNEEGDFGASWEGGHFDTFDLESGQYVTVTGGTMTKDTRASRLEVLAVDFDLDTVTGVASDGANIDVGLFEGYPCTDESPECGRSTTADGSGNWTVDFATDPASDLTPYGSGLVWDTDDDGDQTTTRFGWFAQPDPDAPQKLVASDPMPVQETRGVNFGHDVALDGDTAVIGAPYRNDPFIHQGATYVFERDPEGFWQEAAILTADDGEYSDAFGANVAISGDVVVVGAPNADEVANLTGSAYVFVRGEAGWEQADKLLASDREEGDSFGYSVAVSGATIVVGALHEDANGHFDAGAAYVFEFDGAGWTETAKLVASDAGPPTAGAGQSLGYSVAISGDTILAGAPFMSIPSQHQGAVYVFERNAGGPDAWGETGQLNAAEVVQDDLFGIRVAIDNDVAAAGAVLTDAGNVNTGTAYAFERDGAGVWHKAQILVPPDPQHSGYFGDYVAVSGGSVIIGSPGYDQPGTPDAGAAYVYHSNVGYGLVAELGALDADVNDQFGVSVAIHENTTLVGSRFDDSDIELWEDTGSAYAEWVALPRGGVDCDFGDDLQAAIDAAEPGDTIDVYGHCVGNYAIGKDLTIQGHAGATLDGGGTGRVISIFGDAWNNQHMITLRDLDIVNGDATGLNDFAFDQGGGIANWGSHLTLERVNLNDNVAGSSGGAIASTHEGMGGSLSLVDTFMNGNTATTSHGGGLWIKDGVLTMEGGGAYGNSATWGGALKVMNSWATLTSVALADNYATRGGAIDHTNGGHVSISHSSLGRNLADGGPGGAVYSETSVFVANSTIAYNTANRGGAIEVLGSLEVEWSTIYENTAGIGAGILLNVANGTIRSSILVNNTGPVMDNCHLIGSSFLSLGYNVIDNLAGCGLVTVGSDYVGPVEGIGELGDYGGNGESVEIGSDFAGFDLIPVEHCDVPEDQRLQGRPSGPACDAGAFEYQYPGPGAFFEALPLADAVGFNYYEPWTHLLVDIYGIVDTVVTGTIEGWEPGTSPSDVHFHFNDYVPVGSDIVVARSVGQVDRSWFYGYPPNTTVAMGPVTTASDLCEIRDASAFNYVSWASEDVFWEPGASQPSRYALFHNTSTGFYGAIAIDDIYGDGNFLDATWYLQTNGSADFGPCEPEYGSEPVASFELDIEEDGFGWLDVGPLDLVTGNHIVVTDEAAGESRSTDVVPLTFDVFNPASDLLQGTAEPGSEVVVFVEDESGLLLLHTAIADSERLWSVTTTADLDLQPYHGASARIYDEDGDSTLVHQPTPPDSWIQASMTNHWIALHQWNGDTMVTVDVAGFSYPVPIVEGEGWLDQESFGFNDLEPRMLITATGTESEIVKELELVDGLSITVFDPENDIVEGTAPPEAFVEVDASNEDTGCHVSVQADSNGDWQADFSTGECWYHETGDPAPDDLLDDMVPFAGVYDEDGDSSGVELFDGSELQVQARIGEDSFGGHGWVWGPVAVSITGGGLAEPVIWPEVHPDEEGGFGFGTDELREVLPDGLVPGMQIVVTDLGDPDITHTLELAEVRLESFDQPISTLSGWSPSLPVGEVRFHLFDWDGIALEAEEGHPIPYFPDPPDLPDWSFDLSSFDPQYTPEGLAAAEVEVPDEDNDGTFRRIPEVRAWAGPDPGSGWIESDLFDDDTGVTITVYDTAGGSVVDLVTAEVDSWGEFGVEVPLVAGNEIVAVGSDTGIVKTLVVDRLAIEEIDVAARTLSGTASPYAPIWIEIDNGYDGRQVLLRAEADGSWSADFASDGFEFNADLGGRIRALDEDVDATMAFIGLNPVITSISMPLDLVQVGYPATVNATFLDLEVPDSHTATIEWGDETVTDGVVTYDGNASSGAITGEHVFDTSGVYAITVTVSDSNGLEWSETYEYVVAFDPDGGSITAGGKIDGEPKKTGFNINAQYVAGVASGKVQLRGYGDTLKSTEITWVLVTPEGEGVVQGIADWGDSVGHVFQVSVLDDPSGGDEIEFRIYEPGANPFHDDPIFVIGGPVHGSVKVHL